MTVFNLLVEPDYRVSLPPLGLLKIASYLRNKGEQVQLVKGNVRADQPPSKIYVTSVFTWEWKAVWSAISHYKSLYPTAEVVLGGIYASLMPDHAKKSGADAIHTGLCPKFDDVMPAYDLVPEWDGSLIHTSRGCVRKCSFCPVRMLEGDIRKTVDSIKPFVYPSHTKIIIFDNNAIGSPNWDHTYGELLELNKKVNIRDGIDARLVTDDIAEQLSNLRLTKLQTAYDNINDRDKIIEGIRTLRKHIKRSMPWEAFVLYNFRDTPEDFLQRIKDLAELGVSAFPMRYQPLDALEKNKYISPNWTTEELKAVRKFVTEYGFNSILLPKRLPKGFNRVTDILHVDLAQRQLV